MSPSVEQEIADAIRTVDDNGATPQELLTHLRGTLDATDANIEYLQGERRKAREAHEVALRTLDADIDRLRHVRADLVHEIKLASQRARGIR